MAWIFLMSVSTTVHYNNCFFVTATYSTWFDIFNLHKLRSGMNYYFKVICDNWKRSILASIWDNIEKVFNISLSKIVDLGKFSILVCIEIGPGFQKVNSEKRTKDEGSDCMFLWIMRGLFSRIKANKYILNFYFWEQS